MAESERKKRMKRAVGIAIEYPLTALDVYCVLVDVDDDEGICRSLLDFSAASGLPVPTMGELRDLERATWRYVRSCLADALFGWLP